MSSRFLTDATATRVINSLLRECISFDVAVAWAGENQIVNTMLEHREKLRRVIIGTHMYQTNPTVLRDFSKYEGAKCMPPDGRLFHPKVYLFTLDDEVAVVIGSHNLTEGAFGRNIEASVLIRGNLTDEIIENINNFIQSSWENAEVIDDDFLFAYEIQYKHKQSNREMLNSFHRLKKPHEEVTKPSPLSLSWAEFVRQVKMDKHHSLDTRLKILEKTTGFFSNNATFAEMDIKERKAVAGTYGTKEDKLDKLPWGWFGSMFGQGDFKNLVNEFPEELSNALDHITLYDDVTENQFNNFVSAFDAAFDDKTHKGGVPTASRLLAMKRPDQFVVISKANRRGICGALGTAFSTLSLENYWERIVIPIRNSIWWQSSRPSGSLEDARIWDNRAALLDCIYYDPNDKN